MWSFIMNKLYLKKYGKGDGYDQIDARSCKANSD